MQARKCAQGQRLADAGQKLHVGAIAALRHGRRKAGFSLSLS